MDIGINLEEMGKRRVEHTRCSEDLMKEIAVDRGVVEILILTRFQVDHFSVAGLFAGTAFIG